MRLHSCKSILICGGSGRDLILKDYKHVNVADVANYLCFLGHATGLR